MTYSLEFDARAFLGADKTKIGTIGGGKAKPTGIVDFIDAGHPVLLRMWSKRQAGYKAMGYRLADSSSSMELLVQG